MFGTALRRPAASLPGSAVVRRTAGSVLLATFCVLATVSVPVADPVRPLDAVGALLLVVPAVAAPWAAAALVPVLGLTAVAPVAFYAFGYASIFAPAPVTAAVFVAVLVGRAPYAVAAAAVVVSGTYAAGLSHGLTPGEAVAGPLWIIAWLVAAGAVGEALRKRRHLLEREREHAATAAQRGAEQERLRIARELHDALTHSISVINLQASVATHLADREPARATQALATIRAASAEALHELRSTVEVLRRVDATADPADEPVPSLSRLPHLLARSRSAGVEIVADVNVDAAQLAPEIDRAAYRIVQEALTNAARHAPGAEVVLTIARQRHALTVTVHNGAARTAIVAGPAGSGAGLAGMRERVAAIGGELHAGAQADGFRVHAVLPLQEAAA